MTDDISPAALERQKINAETGKAQWADVQRFFATGSLVIVHAGLDLIDVAYQISIDNSEQTLRWLEGDSIALVSDELAHELHGSQETFWAVVIKPWILIQRIEHIN